MYLSKSGRKNTKELTFKINKSEAQKEMKKEVEKNSAIMVTAEERAKELIANYIKQLGELSNKKYKIK